MFLYGASGHGKVVLEIAESIGVSIEAFIDDNRNLFELLGLPVIHDIPERNCDMVISIGNNYIRKMLAQKVYTNHFPILQHSKSNISKRAIINDGTVVMAGVTINANCVIGKHVIINTNASIDHDCCIEDFVHVSPNAALSGGVVVGEGTHIGTGASIIPNKKIGKWVTIGAGSVIINDVPDFSVVVGNPGRVIKLKTGFE
jgi:acetyltransferase EpsM